MRVVDLHKGVKWMDEGKAADVQFSNIHLQPRYAVACTDTHGSQQQKTIQSKPSPDGRREDTTGLQGFAFQNAESASSGDVFVRLDEGANEVLQAKHYTTPPFPDNQETVIAAVKEELQKSANKTDVFLLHTMSTLPEQWAEWCKQDDDLKDHIIGVVDATSFEDYYKFLAPLWLNAVQQTGEPNKIAGSEQKVAGSSQVSANHPTKLTTGSMLASRPVWPATLSRIPHIPNHTWITPLPPTRTTTTRWVPFLRRICKHI